MTKKISYRRPDGDNTIISGSYHHEYYKLDNDNEGDMIKETWELVASETIWDDGIKPLSVEVREIIWSNPAVENFMQKLVQRIEESL